VPKTLFTFGNVSKVCLEFTFHLYGNTVVLLIVIVQKELLDVKNGYSLEQYPKPRYQYQD